MDHSDTEIEQRIMRDLEQFDTPTITNAVATYAGDRQTCLGLYHPFKINWYTDQERQKLMFETTDPAELAKLMKAVYA